MFLRGVEGGRQVGTKQEAQVGSHQHEVVLPFEQNANGTENNVAYLHFDVNGRTPRKVMTVLPDQPVETRPRNIGVNWIISTGSAD